MSWTVAFTSSAAKQTRKLPQRQKDLLTLLVRDMQLNGPIQTGWKNFSRLGKDTYHCHLSYKWVACWRVDDGKLKLIEVYYAGSRENAPYG